MTVAEIRQMFMGDSVSRRIDSMQELLGRLVGSQQHQKDTDAQRLQATASDRYHEVTLGDVLRNGLRERFHRRCSSGNRKLFRISITPEEPRIVMTSANESSVIALYENPPDQRRDGWNVGRIRDRQRRVGAIVFGDDGHYEVTIWSNGAIEFVNDISHLAWAGDRYGVAGHDYIHPYPLIEYLISFCRLAKKCYSILDVRGNATLEYELLGLSGAILRPYSQNAWGFMRETRESSTSEIYAKWFGSSFSNNPDAAAFQVIREIYHHFGYDDRQIPFFQNGGEIAVIE